MDENSYTVMLAKIRAFRATKEVITDSLKGYDVTIMQWLLLGAVLRDGGETTAKKIAHELNVTMPFVTRLTKQLSTKSMIQIKADEEDQRTKLITLSAKGVRLMEDSEPVVRQALKDWLSEVPKDQVKTYITVLLQVAYKI